MFVAQILPQAHEHLAVVDISATIEDAADLMARPGVDLVVVCEGGVMAGVLSRADVFAQLDRRSAAATFTEPVTEIMVRDVVSCRRSDALFDVWTLMEQRRLQCIPVLDAAYRPIGVVYISDALHVLLKEAETEDEQLRGYIAGVGYR